MVANQQSHIVITEPATEVLTLAETSLHLKMDDISADDSLISSLMIAARQMAENYCGIKFIDTVMEEVFDRFSNVSADGTDCLYLTEGRVSAVSSIKYYDTSSNLVTWDAANYNVDTYRKQARICPVDSFPSADTDRINSVVVRYVCGFGAAASDVPESIKAALKLIIAHLYEHREDTVKKLPVASEYLLQPYRVGFL
jgi:uncharacterized phiE125 gp8 family phage protein